MDPQMLDAVVAAMPCGVIVVDAQGHVTTWNQAAEDFIAAVGRPTLYRGMTMDDAHPEGARPAVSAVLDRLSDGGSMPTKRVAATDGSGIAFTVRYEPLRGEGGAYLGVAQVIEEER